MLILFPEKFAREAPTKSAVLYQSFFSETGLENSREIGRFFREFAPENPAKLDFFPRPTRSPVKYTLNSNSFLIDRKHTVNFRNQPPVTS